MQPDYSRQLDGILSALREAAPWWRSPWILAGFSAMLGVIGGFIGQLIQNVYQERQVRRTLLKLGYGYVGQLLAALDSLFRSPEYAHVHGAALGLVLPARPDDYISNHHDVYVALEEAVVFDVISQFGKRLGDEPGNPGLIRSAIETIVLQFMRGRLSLKEMRALRGREEADTFAAMLARYEPEVRARYPQGMHPGGGTPSAGTAHGE